MERNSGLVSLSLKIEGGQPRGCGSKSGRYHWYMGNHVVSNYVDGQFVVVATDTVIAGLRKCIDIANNDVSCL